MFRDDLPANKATKLKKVIGYIEVKLVFLYSYSPNFNLVKTVSHKSKDIYAFKNLKIIEVSINRTINKKVYLVTDKDIIGWFTQCCYYGLSN